MPNKPQGKGYWLRKLKDPAFQQLQDDWQRKLADSGFEDIETPSTPDLPEPLLKQYAVAITRRSKRAQAMHTDIETALALGLKLSPPHRKLATLIVKGLSYKAITERLKISKSTFYRQQADLLSQAKALLRSTVGNSNVCEDQDPTQQRGQDILSLFADEQQKANNRG